MRTLEKLPSSLGCPSKAMRGDRLDARECVFKKSKSLSHALSVLCLLLLLLAYPSHAVEKKYPPYPDVWEREFVGYIGDAGLTVPMQNGDVLVKQYGEADANGAANFSAPSGYLSFFGNKRYRVKTYEDVEREYYIDKATYINYMRKYEVPTQDGGKIVWMSGALVSDFENMYGGTRSPYPFKEYAGVYLDHNGYYRRDSLGITNSLYYNVSYVLVRTDAAGKSLWRKAYLYFHPWWDNGCTKHDCWYSSYFFKKGEINLVDEDRIFLHFGGTKTIFRIDPKDGNPKTTDKNLIAMDWPEYKNPLRGIIKKARWAAKNPLDISIDPCWIHEPDIHFNAKDKSTIEGNYDYVGEQLAKRFGMDTESPVVQDVLKKHVGVRECRDRYRRFLDLTTNK